MRALVHSLLRNIGFDIKRLEKIGEDPFADMKYFLNGQQGPTVFDVGANVGQTVHKTKRVFPQAIIHSFEPSAGTFETLTKECGQMPGVSTWNYGVGSSLGKLTFFENTNSDMSSFLEMGKDAWGSVKNTTVVDVVTLDDFTKSKEIDYIHVLKSDTQGYDLEVFKGAKELMAGDKIGLIYCELTFSEMYKNLPKFDQIFRYLIDNNFVLVTFYERFFQNEVLGWTDALFINKNFNERRAAGRK